MNTASDSLGFSTVVYSGEAPIGNVFLRVVPPHWSQVQFPPPQRSQVQVQPPPLPPELQEELNRSFQILEDTARRAFAVDIRVAYFSPPSSAYSPLSILLCITTTGVWFKLEEIDGIDARKLKELYKSCILESKTAVVGMDNGKTELHLVAIPDTSGNDRCRFWAITAPYGVYATCMERLNRKSLEIVLDLDETLVVANTSKTFENRIELTRMQIEKEKQAVSNKGMDVQRLALLTAELKRLEDDRSMLRQFVDSDTVTYNGHILPAQRELVSGGMHRPVIRIPGSDTILTRINPEVKDTSVLVRLRPAWNEMRSYLNVSGRKRFEVFVCTMSEKEYALEMLRLLELGQDYIPSKDRLLCVKQGKKLSVLANCHPKLAIVIDDRVDVWDEKDRGNVHLVTPFAPYTSPNAESNLPLRSAKNVASHARTKFFRVFEVFVRKLTEVTFDSDISMLPAAPSVANYINFEPGLEQREVPEAPETNGNGARLLSDEMSDEMICAEVRQMLSSAADDDLQQPEETEEPEESGTKATAGGWLEPEDEEDGDSPTRVDQKGAGTKPVSTAQVEAEAAKWLRFSDPILGLREVALQCMSEVTYRCGIREREELQFLAEVMFAGNKVGQGLGKSHKEAKARAAENGLRSLAGPLARDITPEKTEDLPAFNAFCALSVLCKMEKMKLEYVEHSTPKEFSFEVEVDGQILGKGSGLDKETAKQRASEQALRELGKNSKENSKPPLKRSSSPRERNQGEPEKRQKSYPRNNRYSPPQSRKPYSRNRSWK